MSDLVARLREAQSQLRDRPAGSTLDDRIDAALVLSCGRQNGEVT